MGSQLRFFPLPRLDLFGNRYVWTSGFGQRRNPLGQGIGFHGGVDLACAAGTLIVAPMDGLLNQAWDGGGGGNWSNLWDDEGGLHGFGHASAYYDPDGPTGPATSLNGYRVTAGQTIAYVGTTGGSTGNHLHYAYRLPGATTWQNPTDLLRGAEAAGRYIDTYTPPTIEEILTMDEDKIIAEFERITTREQANQSIRTGAALGVLNGKLDLVLEQLDPRRTAGVKVKPIRDIVEAIEAKVLA